jgi:transcriptional regulator with XRE-family HTH domain
LSRSRRVFSLCFFCARLRLFTFDRTAARCFCVAMDRLYPAECVRTTCEHMFALTYPDYIRLKARELRTERNMSIDEIAERLALSRTTVFYWLRDLPIKRSERPRTLAQLNGSIAMQAKYRLLREAASAVGRTTFDDLAWDPSFRDFLCLYVAEGTKRDRNRVEVCNPTSPSSPSATNGCAGSRADLPATRSSTTQTRISMHSGCIGAPGSVFPQIRSGCSASRTATI